MAGIDSYTKLLLHCDGADASITFIDSATGKTVTAIGNAQIDTAQYKFGGASALFDGTGDGLTTPNHADFDFGSGDFTIDYWFRAATLGSTMIFTSKGVWPPSPPFVIFSDSAYYYFKSSDGSSWETMAFILSGNISINNWYHIAVVRYGNLWNLYLNGVSKSSITSSLTLMTNTDTFAVGNSSNQAHALNGWIDEFRVSKGIARWTANFTPPTEAYSRPSAFFPFL